MADIIIQVRLSPPLFRAGLTSLLLGLAAPELGSESVTLATSYPSPYGVYNKIITTGDTFLAQNTGSVGIGTGGATPRAKLEVNGVISLGSYATDWAAEQSLLAGMPPENGSLYYNSAEQKFKGYQGGAWKDLNAVAANPQVKVYDVPGDFVWTPPAGVTNAIIEVWGAGGGSNSAGGGNGGGGGGYAKDFLTVVPGTNYSVKVGLGGTLGNNGGGSRFGPPSAPLVKAEGGQADGTSGAGVKGRIKLRGSAGSPDATCAGGNAGGGGGAGGKAGFADGVHPGGGGSCASGGPASGSGAGSGGSGRVVIYW